MFALSLSDRLKKTVSTILHPPSDLSRVPTSPCSVSASALCTTAEQPGAAHGFVVSHERSSLMLSSVRFSIVMLCLLGLGSLVSGCAAMADIPQTISVYTVPDGADVTIGEIKGISPMSATVPGGYAIPQSIQVSKDGYQAQTIGVQRGFRTSSLILDIFPGIFAAFIPLIVDAGDGECIDNVMSNCRSMQLPLPAVR
jgi:PEGA domain-containing protein